MIVISNPISVLNEINSIHSLFENGLELLHLRKPTFSEMEIRTLVAKIEPDFRNRLVLHSHHQLAEEFKINRIHFTEKGREVTSIESLKKWKEKGFRLSTSVHSLNDFERVAADYDYAFLGPVFKSISKPNYISNLDFETELKKRRNTKTALIALGGITVAKIPTALQFGFDGVALLGTIWNTELPIENFIQCQKNALLY